MYDPEERAELLKRYETALAKLKSPEMQARLRADGYDPEAVMQKTIALTAAYLAADAEYEQAVEHTLQAGAIMADAAREAFKAARKAVQEHKQLNPLDPRVEEWEDQLEAWAEQMPKEPEE